MCRIFAAALFVLASSLAAPALADKACSVDDKNIITAMPGGHTPDSWPAIVAKCGHGALNVFFGVNQDDFKTCISKTHNVGISEKCNSCYAKMAEYDYENCKMPCLFNWCSTSCITCNRGYDISGCAGWDTTQWPQPTCCTRGCHLPSADAQAEAEAEAQAAQSESSAAPLPDSRLPLAALLVGLPAGAALAFAALRLRRAGGKLGEPLIEASS